MSSSDTLFTLFQQLPKELRIQIWFLTLTPRIITLHSIFPSGLRNARYGRLTPINTQPPVALSVCRESREIVLPRYLVSILLTFYVETHKACEAIVRWNPAIDTLYLPEGPLSYALWCMERPHVRNLRVTKRLAVPAQHGNGHWANYQALNLLRRYTKLKELVFVETKDTCQKCVEGEWNCGQDAGCVGNPRTTEGMGRYTWEVLLSLDAMMSDIMLRHSWSEWKAPRVLVVKRKEDIMEDRSAGIPSKRSPFSDITGFKLCSRIE